MTDLGKKVLECMRQQPERYSEKLIALVENAFEKKNPTTYEAAFAIIDRISSGPIQGGPCNRPVGTWPPRTSSDTVRVSVPKEDGTVRDLGLHVGPTSPHGNDRRTFRLVTGRLT